MENLPFKTSTPKDLERLYELYLGLHDRVRLRILRIIHERGEVKMNELVVYLEMNKEAIGHHLRLLKNHGVVQQRKSGREYFYFINYHLIREVDHWTEKLIEGCDRTKDKQTVYE